MGKNNKNSNNPKDNKELNVGNSFDELTPEEMEQAQGAGDDVNAETTIPCGLGLSISVTAILTLKRC